MFCLISSAFAASALLVTVMLTRNWSHRQGSLHSPTAGSEHQTLEMFSTATVFVTCSTAMHDSGSSACYQCTQVKMDDIPVTSSVQSPLSSSVTEAGLPTSSIIVTATPVPSSKDLLILPSADESIDSLGHIWKAPVSSVHHCRKDQFRGDGHAQGLRSKHEGKTPLNTPDMDAHRTDIIKRHTLPTILYGTGNASLATMIIENSLALTTAIDQAFNKFHHGLVNMGHWLEDTVWTPHRVRNSGRRLIFRQQGSRFFNETDAIKTKVKSEMNDLLASVEQHLQGLTVEMDKAVKETRKSLIIAIRDTADAVERHVGIEIPLPSFVSRDTNRERTKSTVSTWAEKFWQTMHHVCWCGYDFQETGTDIAFHRLPSLWLSNHPGVIFIKGSFATSFRVCSFVFQLRLRASYVSHFTFS